MDNPEKAKFDAEKHRRIYSATHHASDISKIPGEVHFAVLCNESMRYDDGYGERGNTSYSTHNYLQYIYFDTEEALEDWIIKNHSSKSFKVVNVKPVAVEMKTVLHIRDL